MATETKQRLQWLRINDEDEIDRIQDFVSAQDTNTCSNIKLDKNDNFYVLLGRTGHDGFEGNSAAIWFKTDELAEQGKAVTEHLIGVTKQ